MPDDSVAGVEGLVCRRVAIREGAIDRSGLVLLVHHGTWLALVMDTIALTRCRYTLNNPLRLLWKMAKLLRLLLTFSHGSWRYETLIRSVEVLSHALRALDWVFHLVGSVERHRGLLACELPAI